MENNNNNLRQQQKAEAINRMKKLHIMGSVIRDFRDNDVVYYSENLGIMAGILYWLTNEPDYVQLAQDFEKETGGLIYHAELSHTVFGDLLTFFYVSSEKEEWEYDHEDLDSGIQMVYVNNLADPMCSEFGSVYVTPMNGGVKVN